MFFVRRGADRNVVQEYMLRCGMLVSTLFHEADDR